MAHAITRYIFISDLHLGQGDATTDRQRESDFLAFLREEIFPGTHLYLMGDCFNFWFEYRHVIPKRHFRVLAALAALREQGIPITFFAGNHDYWLGPWLEREMGIPFIPDACTLEVNGKRFWIHHGDGLRTTERGYRFMRRFLRSKWCIRLYRWLHPDVGIAFAYWWARTSNARSADLPPIHAEYAAFARERFAEGYDYVIMGHTHRPCLDTLDGKVLLKLGDWLTRRSYAQFDGKTLHLLEWQPTSGG